MGKEILSFGETEIKKIYIKIETIKKNILFGIKSVLI